MTPDLIFHLTILVIMLLAIAFSIGYTLGQHAKPLQAKENKRVNIDDN